jgi:hypothetical protein
MSRKTLPTYIDAASPQNTSGLRSMSRGPGASPSPRSAPSRTAVVPLPGIPRVSSGIMAPVVAALFAASGPATPALVALPEPVVVAGHLLFDAVRQERGDGAAGPGQDPTKKPTTLPRNMLHHEPMSARKRMVTRPYFDAAAPAHSVCSSTRSTSLTAKSPMVTTTKSSPSNSRSCPKVKRGRALFGSMPMVARKRPRPGRREGRATLLPDTLDSAENAKIMSAKYSAGPNRMAHLARAGARNTSPRIDSVPPTNDETAASASASPPRPCLVIACPSIAVTTAEAVPGTLSRIVLIELPYWDP